MQYTSVILLTLISLSLLYSIVAYPNGAPTNEDSCLGLQPIHTDPITGEQFPNQDNMGPYRIELSTGVYQPCVMPIDCRRAPLTVTIRGLSQYFRGFIIQARTEFGGVRSYGQFIPLGNLVSKTINCQNGQTLTQYTNNDRTVVQFQWLPEPNMNEPFRFIATVVQNVRTIYKDVQSTEIVPPGVASNIPINQQQFSNIAVRRNPGPREMFILTPSPQEPFDYPRNFQVGQIQGMSSRFPTPMVPVQGNGFNQQPQIKPMQPTFNNQGQFQMSLASSGNGPPINRNIQSSQTLVANGPQNRFFPLQNQNVGAMNLNGNIVVSAQDQIPNANSIQGISGQQFPSGQTGIPVQKGPILNNGQSGSIQVQQQSNQQTSQNALSKSSIQSQSIALNSPNSIISGQNSIQGPRDMSSLQQSSNSILNRQTNSINLNANSVANALVSSGQNLNQMPTNRLNVNQMPTNGQNVNQMPENGNNGSQMPTNGQNLNQMPTNSNRMHMIFKQNNETSNNMSIPGMTTMAKIELTTTLTTTTAKTTTTTTKRPVAMWNRVNQASTNRLTNNNNNNVNQNNLLDVSDNTDDSNNVQNTNSKPKNSGTIAVVSSFMMSLPLLILLV